MGANMAKVSIKVSGTDPSQPFLRGILTHSLIKRGVAFDDAYEVARKVKARLERGATGKILEVERDTLRKLVEMEIESLLGPEYRDNFLKRRPSTDVTITSGSSTYPFSKGLLARSLTRAGVNPEDSYEMARQLEKEFVKQGRTEVSEDEMQKILRYKIVTTYGNHTAAFYDLALKMHNLDKPVIIYLTGAGGTGKSTLATELAARLGIMKTTGTDMVRQIMRIVFSEEILPSLYGSSFEPRNTTELDHLDVDNLVISNFVMQATKVCVGVKAVVQRAIDERMSIILEGVHLLPGLIQYEGLMDKAYHIPIVLGLIDQKEHKSRLGHRMTSRKPGRYLKNFKKIRLIHDYFVEQAHTYDVDLINNIDYDVTMREMIQITLERLGEKVADEQKGGQAQK